MALPAAEIAHALEGRARLRVSERRGDRAYFATAQRSLAACPAVRRVHGTPVTGSLLLIHEGELQVVTEYARAQGIFEVGAPRPPDNFGAIQQEMQQLEAKLRARTSQKWGTAGLTFYGLLGAGLWQMLQGRVLPPTVTLLFQAMNIYKQALESERAASGSSRPSMSSNAPIPR